MRRIFLTLCASVGVVLAVSGGYRLAASLARAPGTQAIALASVGADLHQRSYERAARALETAIGIRESSRDLMDLVIVHENFGRQQVANTLLREQLYADAIAAFEQRARLSVVEPAGWLLVAQMRYELGDRQGAAEALEWSLRTSSYRRPDAYPRTFLGLGVWDLLEEESHTLLLESIVTTVEEAPDAFAAWAVELDLDDDIGARLAARESDDDAGAEQFALAAENYRSERRAAARAASERAADMRKILAATTLLVTASLPTVGPAMSIADYMSIRDVTNNPAGEQQLNDYLIGVLDGLIMLGSLNREAGAALFCMSEQDTVEVDIESFRRDLDEMLEQLELEVPGFVAFARTRTLGLAALQLLTLQNPCEN